MPGRKALRIREKNPSLLQVELVMPAADPGRECLLSFGCPLQCPEQRCCRLCVPYWPPNSPPFGAFWALPVLELVCFPPRKVPLGAGAGAVRRSPGSHPPDGRFPLLREYHGRAAAPPGAGGSWGEGGLKSAMFKQSIPFPTALVK